VLGQTPCLGQRDPLVDRGGLTWAADHRPARRGLGRPVDLVGRSLADLQRFQVPQAESGVDVFAHHGNDSAAPRCRAVPEFRPVVSLAHGMPQVIEARDRAGRIPQAGVEAWEDRMLAAPRHAGRTLGPATPGPS
jgi:hypothetical protein